MIRGYTDTRLLFGILVFIGAFSLTQVMFGTELAEQREGWNESYSGNVSVIGTGTNLIPSPPVCTAWITNYIPLVGHLIDGSICVGAYVLWLLSLMFITTSIDWLNAIVFLPIVGVIGFIIIRLVRGV